MWVIVPLAIFGQKRELPWFPFTWNGNFINGKWIDKLAIVLPFGASGGWREINVIQLDTGCDVTFFDNENYTDEHKISKEELKKMLLAKIDSFTIQSFFIDMDKKLCRQFSCDSITARNVDHRSVGVIGSDLFENKILIIDYPNTKMCIVDSIESEFLNQFYTIDLKILSKWPVIPFTIDGVEKWLMFDTGSSKFDIYSSKTNWDKFVDKTMPVDTFGPANSWGTPLTFYGLPIKVTCKIGKQDYSRCKFWYSDNDRPQKVCETVNLFGITGNSLFWDKTIIIDYKNKLFGMKK
jgi:hypothetical protein